MISLPSSEMARTLPGRLLSWLTVMAVPGAKVISPASLPRNAFVPPGLNTNELGELGRVVLPPTTLLLVEIGYSRGWHPVIVVPMTVSHCVVVAYTVVVTALPVIRPVIG